MALTANQICVIAQLILNEPTLLEAAASWRKRYPDVRVMRIGAVELRNEKPVLEFRGRRVYLATSTGFCVSVTAQASEADMLIVAEEEACDGD
ncbi:hypothetical protein B0G75_14310 [Paraburkholderia sp. BL18I3N2]|uniref:hypothetical protein n=1 Tax=unclassified Paraburkholderia TaxID=2615204 RepID=UPI000D04B4AB|nr:MULTISPECIES: hypothetical protein [unclassified Paraburkholderia]PRX18463.1 hypothetical protein B0G75_14310 [Paraburkholderia sp. BL18I3N2]PRX92656.1 hypothetical protein B0G73_13483 [Paraburkholderia sp. BL25I1N1]